MPALRCVARCSRPGRGESPCCTPTAYGRGPANVHAASAAGLRPHRSGQQGVGQGSRTARPPTRSGAVLYGLAPADGTGSFHPRGTGPFRTYQSAVDRTRLASAHRGNRRRRLSMHDRLALRSSYSLLFGVRSPRRLSAQQLPLSRSVAITDIGICMGA